MATVGRGVYAAAVYEFFEGMRTFDVDRAVAVLADDADLQSPWGTATGREKIKDVLASVLGDPQKRPSFTIRDIRGDGALVTLTVSISGRFGRDARLHALHMLHLQGEIHQVRIEPQ